MKQHRNPDCPEEALEFALHGEPVRQTISLGFAIALRAVVMHLANGGTETRFVPHATLVGETETDGTDGFSETDYDGEDDIPF